MQKAYLTPKNCDIRDQNRYFLKKAQLSLTNPHDACEKFARLRKSSGIVSCIASLPIDSMPIVSYYVLYSNCVCKMRRFGDTRLLKLP